MKIILSFFISISLAYSSVHPEGPWPHLVSEGLILDLDSIDSIYLPSHADQVQDFFIRGADPKYPSSQDLTSRLVKIFQEINLEKKIDLNFVSLVGEASTVDIRDAKKIIYPDSKLAYFWTRDFIKFLYIKRKPSYQDPNPVWELATLNLFASSSSKVEFGRYVASRYHIPIIEMGISSTRFNRGGNIEVTPNQILYFGERLSPEYIDFFKRFGYDTFPIDTTWLDVGHVDELLTIVNLDKSEAGACNMAIVHADPELAFEQLQSSFETFYPEYSAIETDPATGLLDAKKMDKLRVLNAIFQKCVLPSNEERAHRINLQHLFGSFKTHQAVLARPGCDPSKSSWIGFRELQKFAGSKIKEAVAGLKAKIVAKNPNCAEMPVVGLPQLFVHSQDSKLSDVKRWRLISLGSNVVNMNVIGNHLIVPKPFFRRFSRTVEDKLQKDLGQKVHFVDSSYYSVLGGEIHCGSSEIRVPSFLD